VPTSSSGNVRHNSWHTLFVLVFSKMLEEASEVFKKVDLLEGVDDTVPQKAAPTMDHQKSEVEAVPVWSCGGGCRLCRLPMVILSFLCFRISKRSIANVQSALSYLLCRLYFCRERLDSSFGTRIDSCFQSRKERIQNFAPSIGLLLDTVDDYVFPFRWLRDTASVVVLS
jgi:hypothetical protein